MRTFLPALLICLSCAAAAEGPDGATILRNFIERHQVPYEYELLEIKLVDRTGHSETRRLRRYTRQWGPGQYRHLFVMEDPGAIAGTALLAWQTAGQPDQLWSYLPAHGEVRRQNVSPGSRRNYLLGTDLTYEDILLENADQYQYGRLPDRKLGGHEVLVVRATPANNEIARLSSYSHRDLFLDPETFLLRGIDWYDSRGRLAKQLRATGEPESVGERAWRLNRYVVENLRAAHRTELIVLNRRLEESAVPAVIFEPEQLADQAQRRH